MAKVVIGPQPGPQTMFNSSQADIVILGGAAGGGKTFGLVLDPLRHYGNKLFRGICFRRLSREISMPGGLLDTAKELYTPLGGVARNSPGNMDIRFSSGWQLAFSHLQNDDTVYSYQGLQVAWCGWDELTHFTRKQFFYIATRLRSMAGIKLRIRATCNPDPDSWVKDMVTWYLDAEGRYADPDKAGVIRFFIIDPVTDELIWFASRKEVESRFGSKSARLAKSFAFIPAKLEDNKILMDKSPEYEANLLMQDRVTRARLHKGDWFIREVAGEFFKREHFTEVDFYAELVKSVRFYDRAATEYLPGKNDPDFTCSVKMGKTIEGTFVIYGLSSERVSAFKVERGIKNRASQEKQVKVMAYQDPGGAGKGEAERFKRSLAGYEVDTIKISVNKVTNAKSFSAQCEAGNVSIWRGVAKKERQLFYAQLESFPGTGSHDDYIDAASGAFNELCADNLIQVI